MRNHKDSAFCLLFSEPKENSLELVVNLVNLNYSKDGGQAGFAKGRSEGEVAGLQKGEALKQREIAKNMLQESMPESVIAKIAGFFVEEVEAL